MSKHSRECYICFQYFSPNNIERHEKLCNKKLIENPKNSNSRMGNLVLAVQLEQLSKFLPKTTNL